MRRRSNRVFHNAKSQTSMAKTFPPAELRGDRVKIIRGHSGSGRGVIFGIALSVSARNELNLDVY